MLTIHGTALEIDGKGVLIIGKSKSGKSTTAIQLIALGSKLIADDRTELTLDEKKVVLSAPKSLPLCVEARGIGLLNAPLAQQAPLSLVVDLSQVEKERLPCPNTKTIDFFGYTFPFYFLKGIREPASIVYVFLKFGLKNLQYGSYLEIGDD